MARLPQCIDCKFSDWKKTATGRLHPSGGGICRWQFPNIRLPISRYYVGGQPEPSGGYISRKDAWKQCPQYQKAKAASPPKEKP